ncbi:MAG: DUF4214 domain-containing protein [Saccharofermentans sp.]|nr:DUF4214 domain-containing protein [Saccharofermentans sp.]
MKRKKIEAILLSFTILMSVASRVHADEVETADTQIDATGIAVTASNFPDAKMLAFVSDNFDLDHNGCLNEDEINKATEITVPELSDATGIENFPMLRYLDVRDGSLTSLDVSHNSELDILICNNNALSALDLSHNSSLCCVLCDGNKITSLDVSGLGELETLSCENNPIEYLNISGCTKLALLSCDNTPLKNIDVSDSPILVDSFSPDSTQGLIICNDDTQVITSNQTPATGADAGLSQPPLENDNPNSRTTASAATSTEHGGSTASTNDAGAVRLFEKTPKGLVDKLYVMVLGREADLAGEANWVDHITKYNVSGAGLVWGFLHSSEFQARALSDEEYVDLLYDVFFGRKADEQGKQNWLNMMSNGYNRDQIAQGFIDSEEWYHMCDECGIKSGGTYQEAAK